MFDSECTIIFEQCAITCSRSSWEEHHGLLQQVLTGRNVNAIS